MIPQRSHGFVLTMVLIMFTVIALITAALTQNTQLLITQTHRQQIAAINRNQILSAQAWARHQAEPSGETVILDVNDLSSRPNSLEIQWTDANQINVQAWARWGSQQRTQEQELDL